MLETLELEIEVTVKEGDSSTARGNLLEALSKRVLVAMQHDHVNTSVRITGCELDVVAADRQSGAKVIVECKAYRDRTISAEVLRKLLGTLMTDDFQSAWLISTAKLGKDASGLVESFRSKSIEKRQQLRVYDPVELIKLLISVGQVISPEKLDLPKSPLILATRTLLITDIGEFWAVSALGETSGVADTVLAFDAKSGRQITNEAVVQQLSERDSNLRSLQWVAGADELVAIGALSDASLRQELDSIASVPVADDWSDYRPSRPEDFVGRDDLLKDIVRYLDEVRNGSTSTRLLAIKAPSGWGKSSFLIKLKALCSQGKNKDRIFLYAVDCRTASSPRYPELALKRCFDEAIKASFVDGTVGSCRVASAGHPFADESLQSTLAKLKDQDKIIVLFFDQFEEITTKQELADLFVQVKSLCAAIESAGENVVLGFSWKTDGSIPADHPAYHVWHSFSDRRREFELPLFSKRDILQLLGRLSRELHQPMEHGLKRLLSEHCQGYPWLLKKLCVHVFQVLQSKPARQRELLDRALDVEALFQRDLSDLDATQIACLERIARESPADHFKVAEQFGDGTVAALMQRRLIVRNSGKLVLYWDIFRDYVLSKQVPAIPTRYVPVSSPATAKVVVESLSTFTQVSTISRHLGLQDGTVDNVARDLVMMGACQYDRKNARLRLLHSSERETLAAMFKFLASHALLRKLIEQFGKGFRGVSMMSVKSTLSTEFAPGEYADQTVGAIANRLVSWLQTFGIVSVDGANLLSHQVKQGALHGLVQLRVERRRRSGIRPFVGEAPPGRVLEVLAALQSDRYLVQSSDRNALYVLVGLRLIQSSKEPVLLERAPKGNEVYWLASKVLAQPTMKVAMELIRQRPDAGPVEVADQIEALAARGLSEASKRRYGGGILLWVNWLREVSGTRQAPLPIS
ncbi:restriction endonuclease [Paraburkholderia sp. XV]|uniref:restriction endonuclease n=1 Tax=Paraburkholderia sp. XV TaxID=2831520 RepID=UPI001CD714BC|nr:restriction endonuclease [Paraburkholderia sp. XV]